MSAGLQKIPALDGLRALAILLVFFRHTVHSFAGLSGASPAQLSPQPLWNILFNGWIGVDLFFVLSGYLITSSLLHAPKHHWKIYAQKRFLRIVPAYVAVLALCVLGLFPFYNIPSDDLGTRVFYHLLFLQDYLPANINVVFWSLGVEEKFYILAPFILLLACGREKKIHTGRICFVIGALLLTGYLLRYASYLAAAPEAYIAFFESTRAPFHANLETILLGMGIGFWQHGRADKNTEKPARNATGVFWTAAGLLLLFMAAQNMMLEISLRDALLQPPLIALFMAALVWAAVAGHNNALLDNPVAAYLSRISYSFYLVHFPLAPSCFFLWGLTGSGSVLLYGVIYFCVSFIAASFCYQIFERPFLKMKSRLDRPSS